MGFHFDEIIDRRHTNATSVEGFKRNLLGDPNFPLPCPDDEVVRMWVADMEFAAPDCILKAMHARVDERIFGYTRIYEPDYYEAFSAWCQKLYGWSFPREQLVISHGIIPALYELTGHLCQKGDKVLIMTPTYEPFWGAAQFNHLACVCSDLLEKDGYYTIDFDDFERKAADPAVKVCLFCNPHNPSGRVWSQDELRRVGDICLRNGLWLISDEIHCDLLRTGLRHTPLASLFPDSGHIITCMAPSKTFNIAGLHFSNIIIPDEALRKKWMINHDGNENPLSMAAALAAYRDGYDWMMALRGYLDGNLVYLKEFLSENLPKAVYRVPEATYLAWVDLGAYVAPGTDLVKFFASKAGVLLEAGDSFIRNAGTFVRLNIACPRSMLEEGLRRIAKALND